MKRLTKKKVEEIVWSLYEGYRYNQEFTVRGETIEVEEWGSGVDKDDREVALKEVQEIICRVFHVIPEVSESITDSIWGLRERLDDDDARVVNAEVKDWTKKLYVSQNKVSTPEKVETLRRQVEELFGQIPSDTDFLDPESRKYVKEFSKKSGVPVSECDCLLHWGWIARMDEPKHQKVRRETFDRSLKENSIHVK